MKNSERIAPHIGTLSTVAALFSGSLYARTPTRTILVDQTEDSTDGSCSEPLSGGCNLRAAWKEALSEENSVIRLKVDSLIEFGSLPISARTRSPWATKIESFDEGQKRIISNGSSRLLEIGEAAQVTLSGLAISGFTASEGGAIDNKGDLILLNSTFVENKAICFGTGAMTAFAFCGGGAIVNSGRIVLGEGTRFERNEVLAEASTASYTSAEAKGGAISSTGTVTIAGLTVFEGNIVSAEAYSGIHPMPFGGAMATALGGAISSINGTLAYEPSFIGRCIFSHNSASSDAATHEGDAESMSRGGAIYVEGDSYPSLDGFCVFEGNSARDRKDFASVPAKRVNQ